MMMTSFTLKPIIDVTGRTYIGDGCCYCRPGEECTHLTYGGYVSTQTLDFDIMELADGWDVPYPSESEETDSEYERIGRECEDDVRNLSVFGNLTDAWMQAGMVVNCVENEIVEQQMFSCSGALNVFRKRPITIVRDYLEGTSQDFDVFVGACKNYMIGNCKLSNKPALLFTDLMDFVLHFVALQEVKSAKLAGFICWQYFRYSNCNQALFYAMGARAKRETMIVSYGVRSLIMFLYWKLVLDGHDDTDITAQASGFVEKMIEACPASVKSWLEPFVSELAGDEEFKAQISNVKPDSNDVFLRFAKYGTAFLVVVRLFEVAEKALSRVLSRWRPADVELNEMLAIVRGYNGRDGQILTPTLFDVRRVSDGIALVMRDKDVVAQRPKDVTEVMQVLAIWRPLMVANQTRPQPYFVKMSGPTQVGKSGMVDVMSRIMTAHFNTRGDIKPEEIYRVPRIDTNFFDGYLGQTVFVLDDVLVPEDCAMGYYQTLLHWINTQSQPVEAAAVDLKGRVFTNFRGGILVNNSGAWPHLNKLAAEQAQAIRARVTLHVEVHVREGVQRDDRYSHVTMRVLQPSEGALRPSRVPPGDYSFSDFIRLFDVDLRDFVGDAQVNFAANQRDRVSRFTRPNALVDSFVAQMGFMGKWKTKRVRVVCDGVDIPERTSFFHQLLDDDVAGAGVYDTNRSDLSRYAALRICCGKVVANHVYSGPYYEMAWRAVDPKKVSAIKHKTANAALVVLGGIAAMCAIASVLKKIFTHDDVVEEVVESQYGKSGGAQKHMVATRKKVVEHLRSVAVRANPTIQMGQTLPRPTMVQLGLEGAGKVFGIMMYDHVCITVRHFWNAVMDDPEKEVTIVSGGVLRTVRGNDFAGGAKVAYPEDVDVICIESPYLPSGVKRDLGMFLPEAEWPQDCMNVLGSIYLDGAHKPLNVTDVAIPGVESIPYHDIDRNRVYHIKAGLVAMTEHAKPGVCGTPWFVAGRIAAMHVAGAGGCYGFALQMTRESVKRLISQPRTLYGWDVREAVVDELRSRLGDTVIEVGPDRLPLNETRLVVNEITADVLPHAFDLPAHVPPHLNMCEEDGAICHTLVDGASLVMAYQRRSTIDPTLNTQLREVFKQYGVAIASRFPGKRYSLVDFEEAIQVLDVKKSMGPCSLGTGLTETFIKVDPLTGVRRCIKPELRALCCHAIDGMMAGMRVEDLLDRIDYTCKAVAKDEKMASSDKMPRVFYVSPIVLRIVGIMIHHRLEIVMKSDPVLSTMGVGLNPLSVAWDLIANNMASGLVRSYDIRKQDISKTVVQDGCLEAFFSVFYTGEHYVAMKQYHGLIDRGLPIMYGPVLARVGPIWASGLPLTSITQSVLNGGSAAYAYGCATQDHFDPELYVSAYLACNPVHYGDDNVASACMSDSDFVKFCKTMSCVGYDLTAPDKGAGVGLMSLSEVQFLKRSFVYNDRLFRWMCPLDKESLVNVHQTRHTDQSERDHFVAVCEPSLNEAAMHGGEFYDKFYKVTASMARSLSIKTPPYVAPKERLARVYEKETGLLVEVQMGDRPHERLDLWGLGRNMKDRVTASARGVVNELEAGMSRIPTAFENTIPPEVRTESPPHGILHRIFRGVVDVGKELFKPVSWISSFLGLGPPQTVLIENNIGAALDATTDMNSSMMLLTATNANVSAGGSMVDANVLFTHYCDKECIVYYSSWNTSSSVGTRIVADLPVTPGLVYTTGTTTRTLSMTPAACAAYLFEAFSAKSCTITVEIVTDVFVTGKLLLFFTAAGGDYDPTTANNSNKATQSVILDLAKTHRMSLVVPNPTSTPTFVVPVGTGYTGTSLVPYGAWGSFGLAIYHPITSNGTLPGTLPLNLYYSWQGMTFYKRTTSVINALTLTPQMGDRGDDSANQSMPTVEIPTFDLFPANDLMLAGMPKGDNLSVSAVLERWVNIVPPLSWTSTATPFTVNADQAILGSEIFQKFSSYASRYRYDYLEVCVEVNAPPSVSGMLRVACVPAYSLYTNSWINGALTNFPRTGNSFYPHIDVLANGSRRYTIRLPYLACAPDTFLTFITSGSLTVPGTRKASQWTLIAHNIVAPVNTQGGSSTATLTVAARYVGLDIRVPVHAVAQMGDHFAEAPPPVEVAPTSGLEVKTEDPTVSGIYYGEEYTSFLQMMHAPAITVPNPPGAVPVTPNTGVNCMYTCTLAYMCGDVPPGDAFTRANISSWVMSLFTYFRGSVDYTLMLPDLYEIDGELGNSTKLQTTARAYITVVDVPITDDPTSFNNSSTSFVVDGSLIYPFATYSDVENGTAMFDLNAIGRVVRVRLPYNIPQNYLFFPPKTEATGVGSGAFVPTTVPGIRIVIVYEGVTGGNAAFVTPSDLNYAYRFSDDFRIAVPRPMTGLSIAKSTMDDWVANVARPYYTAL